MIVSKPKPMEVLLGDLEGDRRLFVLGCGGCAEGCGGCPEGGGIGSAAQVVEMAAALREAGKEVVATLVVDLLCNKALVGSRLARRAEELREADALVVITCGIGVQAVARMVDRPVRAALDTVSMGGGQGCWAGEERCLECGDCVLSYTGGICPVTACSKSLMNGICGGSNEGMCEVAPTRPCGWVQIYERCEALGELDRLHRFLAARDWQKRTFPEELRTTVRWALEVEEDLFGRREEPSEAPS